MVVLTKNTGTSISKNKNKTDIIIAWTGGLLKSKLSCNFLLAKKTPKVKWKRITKEEIVAAIPNPWFPYANKHKGNPMLPVLGKIKGGNSVTMSFLRNFKKITPIKLKAIIRIKEYQKYSTKMLNEIPVVVIA